jgi:hypothetical protein
LPRRESTKQSWQETKKRAWVNNRRPILLSVQEICLEIDEDESCHDQVSQLQDANFEEFGIIEETLKHLRKHNS